MAYKGGKVVAAGLSDDIINVSESYTGQYLKPYLEKEKLVENIRKQLLFFLHQKK